MIEDIVKNINVSSSGKKPTTTDVSSSKEGPKTAALPPKKVLTAAPASDKAVIVAKSQEVAPESQIASKAQPFTKIKGLKQNPETSDGQSELKINVVAKSDVIPQIRRFLPWTVTSGKDIDSQFRQKKHRSEADASTEHVRPHALGYLNNNDATSLSELLAHLASQRVKHGVKLKKWRVSVHLQNFVESGMLLSVPLARARVEPREDPTSSSSNMEVMPTNRPFTLPHLPGYYREGPVPAKSLRCHSQNLSGSSASSKSASTGV